MLSVEGTWGRQYLVPVQKVVPGVIDVHGDLICDFRDCGLWMSILCEQAQLILRATKMHTEKAYTFNSRGSVVLSSDKGIWEEHDVRKCDKLSSSEPGLLLAP